MYLGFSSKIENLDVFIIFFRPKIEIIKVV